MKQGQQQQPVGRVQYIRIYVTDDNIYGMAQKRIQAYREIGKTQPATTGYYSWIHCYSSILETSSSTTKCVVATMNQNSVICPRGAPLGQ